jgi:hypothetical protein
VTSRFSASEYRRYAKLIVIICCQSQAVLAAVASTGPTPDIDKVQGVMDRPPLQLNIETMVADAGFDSAFNHRLLRETHGIRSTIPPEYGRPPNDPAALPTDKHRRLMKRRFNTRAHRFRADVETVMSTLKRNLSAALSPELVAFVNDYPARVLAAHRATGRDRSQRRALGVRLEVLGPDHACHHLQRHCGLRFPLR